MRCSVQCKSADVVFGSSHCTKTKNVFLHFSLVVNDLMDFFFFAAASGEDSEEKGFLHQNSK